MTDKQPDALKLAYFAETANLAGYPTAKKTNAYYLCLLEDCAQMIRRLHAENETLRAGYAAARLEIESLKAAILAEREACAKVCEAHAYGWEKNPGNNPIAGFISASNCAGDIRLRSNAAPQPSPAPLSAREIELLDGLIDAQLNHAKRCDLIPNRPMAEKQKGWDMERVTLLRKLKATMGGPQP